MPTTSTAPAQPALRAEQAGHYRLEGALTFATVTDLDPAFSPLLATADTTLTIDLSQVPQVDSAGLALLVHWLALARAHGRSLRYAALSEALRALAKLSDVEALLTDF